MSAFISVRFTDEIHLFADGAAYDRQGTMTAFVDKIKVGKVAPVAIACRGGPAELVTRHAELLCDMADQEGIEELLRTLESYESSLCARRIFKEISENSFDFAIALCLPNGNLKHYRLHSCAGMPDFAPFKLHEIGDFIACGSGFSPQTLFDKGILPVWGDTTKWAKTKGVEIMEIMRQLPGVPLPGQVVGHPYVIGGHVDLATITRSGVRLRRVRRWDDKIGEKMMPTQQETPIGNRQARRLAKAARRHAA